jgi:hypothetical protein
MSEIIKFIATDEYGWEVAPRPFPASQAVPQWWKDMTPYVQNLDNPEGKKFILQNRVANTTFKKCVPMLDAMISGYIIPLWADIQVTQNSLGPQISWRVSQDVFEIHGGSAEFVENQVGFNKNVFKYLNKWYIKTPPGYSCLITQPFGYRDTHMQAVPAIIDTDKSTLQILPPIWIEEGFEGIIEKGTPIIQVTPFKRTSWKSEFSYLKDGEYQKIEDKNFGSTLINHYVKNVWSKKDYK